MLVIISGTANLNIFGARRKSICCLLTIHISCVLVGRRARRELEDAECQMWIGERARVIIMVAVYVRL